MNLKTSLSRYLWILIVLLLSGSFILPSRYGIPYPQTLGPKFDPIIKREYINAITENKPDVVLLGDSILYFGVDQTQLTSLLNTETYSMGIPGSASAVWYLALKNMILESAHTPKYVVILFRDTVLTLPSFRTTGRYFELLDDFARTREPLTTELAFVNHMSPAEKIAERYFPLYSARWEIRIRLDGRLRYGAASALLNCPQPCADEALNSIFGKQGVDVVALNRAVEDSQQTLYTSAAMNFEKQIDKSFLPAMIRLAQENNVALIFVRTKTLTYPEYDSEPPALRAYIQSLKEYLSRQNGAAFLDLAHDKRIERAYFSDNLHFNAEGKTAFTQILADELKALVK
ncbi:MAG: SGNH/GDSL hydrolase family protein [Anaerolineales bacterium]|nr:SGNH/GDSL hydrolase family protein [Anaerolineales bacterium]